MSESEARSERVLELAEEFLERYRKGERPPLKEYIDRHPELAAEIKEVFPAMAILENIAVVDESLAAPGPESEAERQKRPALQQLGDFRIIREIGHGGMGVVYEAEQVSLGRHVALKLLPNHALHDAKQKLRFEREAKAAAKLHHTNIVPVFGVGEHDGVPYYVMQFIQGLGLDAVLDELNHMQPGAAPTPTGLRTAGEIHITRRDVSAADVARSLMTGAFQQSADADEGRGPKPSAAFDATFNQPTEGSPQQSAPSLAMSGSRHLDSFTVSSSSLTLPGTSATGRKASAKKQTYSQSVANIGRQVAEALEYAHKQGVLHRDVKPSNLLLDMRGTVWVTDFGLAKVAGPGGENLTHTGDILGTLRYMPPEAFEGRSDSRSDVYSLGITLYELLAMRPAFDEKDRNKLIKQVTSGEPTPLDKVKKEIPRDLVTIIQKSIAREPSRRYATAEDLASDLQRFLDDEPIQARRQTQMERYVRWARHNPGIATLGGVLTAVLVLVTVASLIVAGHMSNLAQKETQAATDERTARHDAEVAKNREAEEKVQAELAKNDAVLAKKDAEASRKRAEAALHKAEVNFAKARSAVNDYLTAVSDDERLKAPGLQGLRIQLLQSALQFYQEFLKERGNDPMLRRELAGVYYKVGEIYRDLGQGPAANQSYLQARRLYEALVSESSDDKDLQYGLAMALSWTGARARAIRILEKLINPADPKYHADLGDLYNSEALAVNNAKKDKTAKTDKTVDAKQLEYLRKSLTVRERLVRLRPDDAEARLGFAGSLNNIAIRLKEDHNAEALALIQRSVEQTEAAHRLRPAHLLTARYLTIGLNNLANWGKKSGETELVLAAHRRRVEVLDRRARDNPTIPGFDAELMAGYTALLNELRDASRLEEAAKTADKARVRLAETTEETTEFFRQVASFHLCMHSLTLARAEANPDGELNTESEAAAAVNAMRQHTLAGWRDPNWLRTDSRTEPLRQRADFKELLARQDEIALAYAAAQQTTATTEEKLAARQTILTSLEFLAGPAPHARFVRRNLAQARQDWAQALLETGHVDEAQLAFDDALAARQQLVQEAPSNEQLRADLAQSQSAAGDLFAAAGKLGDAVTTWEKALATLEEALKQNPNSIPFKTALVQQLAHIGYQYGNVGLWEIAVKHHQRAFDVQASADFNDWLRLANLLLETGDMNGYRSFTARVVAASAAAKGVNLLHLGRIIVLLPDGGGRYPDALKQVALGVNIDWQRDWPAWCQGITAIRLGQPEQALTLLEKVKDPLQQLPARALALHQLGRTAAAKEMLQQADAVADQRLRDTLSVEQLKIPDANWVDWLALRALRREAHQAIHGQPMPESPYDKLFRGRILSALGDADKAEAEFTAAVQIRADDVDVWLTRSRLFAILGQPDRMTADLLRAQQIKGDDPKTWIETGRMLAERGEHAQADAAFAKAFALGKGDLNLFLNSGWWAAGPYYGDFNRTWPPESANDPAKPVAALHQSGDLKWQTVPTDSHTGSVALPIHGADTSVYALNYVYSDRERTASLQLQCNNDARLWVNGRLLFDGLAAWNQESGAGLAIPITLRAGRNVLLVRVRPATGGFACRFGDGPNDRGVAQAKLDKAEDHYARLLLIHPDQPRLWIDRGRRLGELGRWDEAAQAFARATELAPNLSQVWKERGRVYADFGKWDEAAADLAKSLELIPAHNGNPNGMPWWAADNGIGNALVESADVFSRLTQKRVNDLALVARRMHYLAARGSFKEAIAVQAHAAAMAPDNPVAVHVLAMLQLRAGDQDGYRTSCRKLLNRYPPSNNDTRARMILTCLLVPDLVNDKVALRQWADSLAVNEKNAPSSWHRVAQILADFRQGEYAAVDRRAKKWPGDWHFDSVVRPVEAMALERLGRHSEAVVALRKAQTALARFSHEFNRVASAPQWWEFTRGRVLLDEAEAMIRAAPAIAEAPAASPAQQDNAWRDRKARADSLATQAALAQIRLDVGQATEAEAELRAILAEREKIAAEEPDNLDYQADRATAHQQLGQFLESDGRNEEGVKETQQAVALLERIAAGEPISVRHQVKLASNLFGIGNFHWKAGRLAEGSLAWQKALDRLAAARGTAATDPKLAKLAVDLELAAGRAYADLGLWTEASGHFRRAFEADPIAAKVTDRFNHAALLVLTGAEAEYRRYCNSVYERGGKNLQDSLSARMMVLGPGALSDPMNIAALAERARSVSNNEAWTILTLALAQLRADQVDAAFATFQEFETISKGEWQFSWPALALARHKAGKIDEAREWLRKTEDWYSSTWAKHLVVDSSGLPKDGSLSFWTVFLSLRREAIATVTGQPAPADPWLHLHRGRIYVKLGQPDKAEAEFEAAVNAQPDNPRILLCRSRIYAGLGKLAEARTDHDAAIKLAEQSLTKRPDDAAAADALAGLLTNIVEPKWTALKPLAVKSEGGATLTVKPDDSVLASGINPDNDVYVIEAEVQGRIGAIRLEAIPDASMPKGASGRSKPGNFVLTDFRVTVNESVVAWSRAYADFSQEIRNGKIMRFPIAFAIDADESTGWAIHPRVAEPHWGVFIPSQPITAAGKTRLTIRLAFRSKSRTYNLGRFRLSVTDSDPIPYAEWFTAAETPHAKVGAAYLAVGDARRAADFLTKATTANPKSPAADWLVLALAHANLKQIDQARQACGKAAASLRPAGASAALRPLLREVSLAIGGDCAEVKDLLDAAAAEVPAALNDAIRQNPANAAGHRNRGNWFATHGRWQEAVADFTEVFRLNPTAIDGLKLCTLLVQVGDMDRYQALCRDMLARWSSTNINYNAERVTKTCLLHPDSKVAPEALDRLAQRAVAGDPKQNAYEWYLFAKSLHELRSGKYGDALTSSRETRQRAATTAASKEMVTSLALIIASMALHRSEKPAEARSVLAEAKSLLDKNAAGLENTSNWHDWLSAHILYREADDLIAPQDE